MTKIDEGLTSWRSRANHNRMIDFQLSEASPDHEGPVQIGFFGTSAFRITCPSGMTVLIDPWRNPPWGTWDWYRREFPSVDVDIGISTHAHFDHDALHRLDASMLLDRPIGRFEIGDARITGIADKHVCEAPPGSTYDWAELYRKTSGIENRPPDNPRSFDNTIVIIETGGLKIVHWGDNRPDPEQHVWDMIGRTDIMLIPVDGSNHLLSDDQVDEICARLKARAIVPCHYFTWELMHRACTLQTADEFVAKRDHLKVEAGSHVFRARDLSEWHGKVVHFGDHVAFEKVPLKADPVGEARR